MTSIITKLRAAFGRHQPHAGEPFAGSAAYWQQRYADGGNSGAGSYGKFAAFKAQVLNGLFAEFAVASVIEFGCGDGNQLAQLTVADYLGVDISAEAIARCRAQYSGQPGRSFVLLADYSGQQADASLSLDVIYHLVEDAVYGAYMQQLFSAARRLVIVYSSNRDDPQQHDGVHVRHREFTRWVADHEPQWQRVRSIANAHPYRGDYREGSFADFHVFARSE